jgi:hypothetical protein
MRRVRRHLGCSEIGKGAAGEEWGTRIAWRPKMCITVKSGDEGERNE